MFKVNNKDTRTTSMAYFIKWPVHLKFVLKKNNGKVTTVTSFVAFLAFAVFHSC